MIDQGTKNGEILRGPLFRYSSWVFFDQGQTADAGPIATPIRSPFTGCASRPASLIA